MRPVVGVMIICLLGIFFASAEVSSFDVEDDASVSFDNAYDASIHTQVEGAHKSKASPKDILPITGWTDSLDGVMDTKALCKHLRAELDVARSRFQSNTRRRLEKHYGAARVTAMSEAYHRKLGELRKQEQRSGCPPIQAVGSTLLWHDDMEQKRSQFCKSLKRQQKMIVHGYQESVKAMMLRTMPVQFTASVNRLYSVSRSLRARLAEQRCRGSSFGAVVKHPQPQPRLHEESTAAVPETTFVAQLKAQATADASGKKAKLATLKAELKQQNAMEAKATRLLATDRAKLKAAKAKKIAKLKAELKKQAAKEAKADRMLATGRAKLKAAKARNAAKAKKITKKAELKRQAIMEAKADKILATGRAKLKAAKARNAAKAKKIVKLKAELKKQAIMEAKADKALATNRKALQKSKKAEKAKKETCQKVKVAKTRFKAAKAKELAKFKAKLKALEAKKVHSAMQGNPHLKLKKPVGSYSPKWLSKQLSRFKSAKAKGRTLLPKAWPSLTRIANMKPKKFMKVKKKLAAKLAAKTKKKGSKKKATQSKKSKAAKKGGSSKKKTGSKKQKRGSKKKKAKAKAKSSKKKGGSKRKAKSKKKKKAKAKTKLILSMEPVLPLEALKHPREWTLLHKGWEMGADGITYQKKKAKQVRAQLRKEGKPIPKSLKSKKKMKAEAKAKSKKPKKPKSVLEEVEEEEGQLRTKEEHKEEGRFQKLLNSPAA